MQGLFIYFFLNFYLVQFLIIFSTLPITFFRPFPAPSTTFFGPKKLYWTGITSTYPPPRLIRFSVTLHLMAGKVKVRKGKS